MSHKGWEIKHWAPKINPPFKPISYHNPLHPQPLRVPCFCQCRGCPQAGSPARSAQLWLTASPPLRAAEMTPCRSVRTLPSSSENSSAAPHCLRQPPSRMSFRSLPSPAPPAVTHPTEQLMGVPKQCCCWQGSVTEARRNYPSRN